MVKKILCLMLALTLVTVSFAGCSSKAGGSSASASSAQTNDKDKAFTISVDSWFLVKDTDPDNLINQNYKDAVDKAYKKIYPNATVKWDLTTSEKYFDLLKAKLASGTEDDVFFHQGMLVTLAKGGYLADLSNVSYANRVLESTKPGVEYNGKLYGVVRSVDGWAVWYNKKMFEENGWSTPKTWDEFLKLCAAIKAKGISPLMGGFKNTWTLSGFSACDSVDIYYNNPKWEYDLYNGKVKFNGAEYQKYFKKFETIAENGYYNKDCLSIDWEQSRAYFEQGKAAMMMMGDWLPVQVASEDKDFQIGFFNLPDENGNTLIPLSINQVGSVNAKAKDLQKAEDLLGAIIDKNAMEIGLKNNGFSGVSGVDPEYTIAGTKEFAQAIQNDKTIVAGLFMPSSVGTTFINISTEILAGKKFTNSMLDELDKTYQQDKNQVSLS